MVHFDTISLAPFRVYFPHTPATLGHHNIESHMLLRRAENEPNRLKRWYFSREGDRVRAYERQNAQKFAAHIVCSELDRDRLLAVADGAKVAVVPNGVDIEYFRPQVTLEGSRKRSIIIVGSLNWYPNVDAVLFLLREIWPTLKKRVPDLLLDVVGSAPPAAVLSSAAALDGVRIHGFVQDVRPLMEAATVYVCPIRDGGGTKLKVLDAFAMGKCVVAHPIACEGIAVTPGSDVLLAQSAHEFVEAIELALGTPLLRARLGEAARGLVAEHYSFPAIAERLADLFTAVASGPAADNGLISGDEDDDVRAAQRG
jgi:glycosyltransferase involved in cell wall biosynthesis